MLNPLLKLCPQQLSYSVKQGLEDRSIILKRLTALAASVELLTRAHRRREMAQMCALCALGFLP